MHGVPLLNDCQIQGIFTRIAALVATCCRALFRFNVSYCTILHAEKQNLGSHIYIHERCHYTSRFLKHICSYLFIVMTLLHILVGYRAIGVAISIVLSDYVLGIYHRNEGAVCVL